MTPDLSNLNLIYSKRVSIKYKSAGLNEPSGVVLTKDKDALWVVSDNKNCIFQADLKGNLNSDVTFEIEGIDLEGITLDEQGILYAVSEDKNTVIAIGNGQIIRSRKIKDMKGYSHIAKYFDKSENKGLEGITSYKGSLFLLKEGPPGLLINISNNLEKIVSHRILNEKKGFDDDDIKGKKIDYSGICFFSASNQIFWIVSDKAKRIFLYDWGQDKVIKSFPLAYSKNGKEREIRKAEGITYNPDDKRLYIVSDEEARLYMFELR
jgi:uncharacterized protein YjiK